MFERILRLGLVAIPFIFVSGQDIRELKLALTLGFALTLIVVSLYDGTLKPFKNLFALLILPHVWLSTMLAPGSGLKIGNIPLGIFWAWKPMMYITACLLAIVAISSAKLDKDKVIKTMFWSGFAMAVYIALQFFHIDQFFKPNGYHHEQWNMAGMIGHPTFVAPFVAMMIPLAIYLKRYKYAVFMGAVVLVTQSQVAIGAMVLALLFLMAQRGRKQAVSAIIILLIGIGAVLVVSKAFPGYVTDSGRFYHWKLIAQDINSPIREGVEGHWPLTGLGLGSFYYTFHVRHHNLFFQAHNEYFEWLYNCGLVGLFLFVGAIWWIVKRSLKQPYLLASFLCIAICAGGTFVWQLGAMIFPTMVIVGLLHNGIEQAPQALAQGGSSGD